MIRDLSHCAAASAAFALMALQAAAQSIAVPPVPENLKPPAGNVVFLKGYAVGSQNWVCLPNGSGGLGWKFQGPQATLSVTFKWFNREIHQQIATHYLSINPVEQPSAARATWQSSIDTSSIWAMKTEESSDPAFVAPGAIPWLLLRVVGAQRGPNDGAMLFGTTFIQRVNTSGGIMPTTACTVAGAIEFVPYTTDYFFYRAAE